MTKEEKIKSIMAYAASKVGMSCDIYYDLAMSLKEQGVLEQRTVYTKVGNRVDRWFLKAA